MNEIKFIIPINPITKKNHSEIMRNSRTGKPFLVPSKQYRSYEKQAGWFLKPLGIAKAVNIKCLFYMGTRRKVDLANLLSAIDDVLVKYNVIVDDESKIVAGHDGSRVLYDKENPRTEIIISPIGANIQRGTYG